MKQYFGLLLLSLVGVFFLFFRLLFESYMIAPDSEGYISNYAIRQPIYPLILDFFNLLSVSNYLALTFYFQLIFGFSILTFSYIQIVKLFHLPSVFYILFFIILFQPYFFYPMIGNKILTEAIAYPLFIFLCLWIVKFILNPDYKSLIYITITTCLLILTRGQFKFLLIAIPLILCLFFCLNKRPGVQIKYVIILFLFGVLFTTVIDRGYHYLYNDQFRSEPGTGIWMVVPALYISSSGDTTVLKTKLEKDYFNSVYAKLDSNNLTLSRFREKSKSNNISIGYSEAWNKICWIYSYPLMNKYVKESDPDISVYRYDQFLSKIASKLILKNYKDYILLLFKNFIRTFYSTGYAIMIMCLILLLISQLVSNLYNANILASLAMLLLAIFNNMLIGFILYPEIRVQLYSDVIINMQVIIFSYYAFKYFQELSCAKVNNQNRPLAKPK